MHTKFKFERKKAAEGKRIHKKSLQKNQTITELGPTVIIAIHIRIPVLALKRRIRISYNVKGCRYQLVQWI
jgi:hypothetical protein